MYSIAYHGCIMFWNKLIDWLIDWTTYCKPALLLLLDHAVRSYNTHSNSNWTDKHMFQVNWAIKFLPTFRWMPDVQPVTIRGTDPELSISFCPMCVYIYIYIYNSNIVKLKYTQMEGIIIVRDIWNIWSRIILMILPQNYAESFTNCTSQPN